MVELVGGDRVGGGDWQVFERISEVWPVGFLPAWSGCVVIRERGAYGYQNWGGVGSGGGEGRRVPRAKGWKNMWVALGQVNGTWSEGSCERKLCVNSLNVEEGEA